MKTIFVSMTIITLAVLVASQVKESNWNNSLRSREADFKFEAYLRKPENINRIEDLSVKQTSDDIKLVSWIIFSARTLVYNDPLALTLLNMAEKKWVAKETPHHGIVRSRIESTFVRPRNNMGALQYRLEPQSPNSHIDSNEIEASTNSINQQFLND